MGGQWGFCECDLILDHIINSQLALISCLHQIYYCKSSVNGQAILLMCTWLSIHGILQYIGVSCHMPLGTFCCCHFHSLVCFALGKTEVVVIISRRLSVASVLLNECVPLALNQPLQRAGSLGRQLAPDQTVLPAKYGWASAHRLLPSEIPQVHKHEELVLSL